MAHLTESHRIKIEHYLNENYSYRKIAELLNVNVSTISREVKRNIRTYSISNVYTPNNKALKYMRQNLKDLREEIDESSGIIGDFNTLLSEIDRSNRHKISKDIAELNSIIVWLDIIDIYKLIHSTTDDYTLFSSSHEAFIKINHILGH